MEEVAGCRKRRDPNRDEVSVSGWWRCGQQGALSLVLARSTDGDGVRRAVS